MDTKSLLRAAMDAQGITDNELRAGIAAIAGGESAFKPVAEIGYAHTPNARIRSIFGAAKKMSDAQLNALKADDAKFFEAMYGMDASVGEALGNVKPGDGYLFRGRGLLQLTGRANYTRYGKLTGHPELVTQPDLANDPELAAAIAVAYMRDRYHGGGFDAMKRAVGNSFGNVDDRKNALFRQFLADGSFNAASAAQQEKPMPKKAATTDASGVAVIPSNAPTASDSPVLDLGSFGKQFLEDIRPTLIKAVDAGVDIAEHTLPGGFIIGMIIGPQLVDQWANHAVDVVEGIVEAGGKIELPTDGVVGYISNLAYSMFSKSDGTVLDFLENELKKDVAPMLESAIEKLIAAGRAAI